jgi:uncharacterized protein YukE
MAIADFVVKLGVDTKALDSAVKAADQKIASLNDAEINLSVDSSEALGDLSDVAKKTQALPDGSVKVDADTTSAKSALSQLSEQFGGLIEQAKGGDIKGAVSGAGEAFSGLGQTATAALGPLAAAFAAFTAIKEVLGFFVGAIGDAIEAGENYNKAMKNIAISTGLSGESLQQFGDQASKAFQLGIGENVADAAEQLGKFRNAVGNAFPTEELAEFAARANAVGTSFGIEAPELVAKLKPLMTEFGLTADEALERFTATAQAGVADVNGLADAVQEFAPAAKEAGASSEQFTNALQVGANRGLKDLAKVGDGYKNLVTNIQSGAAATQAAQIGGDLGGRLADLAKQAEQGKISAQEFGAEYSKTLDKARKDGQISAAQQKQYLVGTFGAIAEDIGAENTIAVFTAEVDPKSAEAAAKKAGQTIQDALPPPDLGRFITGITTELGAAFDNIKKAVFAPFLRPLLDGFEQIRAAFAEAFGGAGAGAGQALTAVFKTLGQVFGVVVNNVVNLVKIGLTPLRAIFDALSAATAPLREAFGRLFSGAGDGSGVFETLKTIGSAIADIFGKVLYGAIRLVLKPFELLSRGIGFLAGLLVDVVQYVYDWVTSFQPLRDAINAIVETVTGAAKAIGDFVGSIGDALGITSEQAPKAADAVEKVGDAAEDASDKVKDFAGNLQSVAKAFDDSQAAAQANLDLLVKNGAATGGYRSEIGKAAQAVRKFERALDSAALAGDPIRQRAITEGALAASRDLQKASDDLTAGLIANQTERNAKLLALQQQYDLEVIDQQIKTAQVTASSTGSGVAEAQQALAALQKQRLSLVKQQERDIALAQGEVQQARLDELVAREQQGLTALVEIQNASIAKLQRNVDALGFGDVDKLISANIKAIQLQTDAAVRSLVEATPEFTKAAAIIGANLANNLINADEAKTQLADLRKSVLESLTSTEGGTALGEQITAILQAGETQAKDVARSIRDNAQDAAVGLIRSDIVRGIEEQVRALEKQRDVLLQNTNLTNEQRAAIEQGYGQAIDKVRKGSFNLFQSSVDVLAQSLSDIQVNLESDEAQQQLEDLAKANDDLIASFERGEITYQDALAGLQQATEGQVGLLSKLGDAAGQALSQVLTNYSASFKTGAEETIATVTQLQQDINKIRKDTTITDEGERAKQIARVNEEIATSQVKAIQQLGAAGAAEFAALVVSGENVGDSLKKVAGDLAKSLLALYTPGIVALFSQIIPPPFGQIAGFAAVASLQALLSTALASFADGGYTGDGGKYQAAGIVHAGEFVAPQTMTRKHRGLLEHLYANKPLESFPSIQKMLDANRITVANEMRNGIYAPSSSQAMQVGVDLSPMVSELRAMRSQLEAMETLQKTSTDVVVSADKDAVIRQIKKANFRNTRR